MARNENVFMARKKQYGSHPPFPVDNCRRRRHARRVRYGRWRQERGAWRHEAPRPRPARRRGAPWRSILATAIASAATRLGVR